jgi:ornithine cyclodeaminase/alanine dehydrogenase-like protein (mu-crystallin family)
MKFFDAEATREGLAFDRLIPALSEMFQSECEVPPRHVHAIDGPDGPDSGGLSLIMPAWQVGRWLGIKTVNIFPGNQKRQLPGLFSTYILYDATTGEPVALLDGNEITSRRTAAASALAASYLAPPDASTHLVVGCGRVGSLLAEAYRAVLPIRKVLLWDIQPSQATALAEALNSQGIAAEAVSDLPAAASAADVVSCATLSKEALIQGAWLRAHSHLDLIGSFTPEMREADDACLANAQLFVDTGEALEKSGDLLGPMSRGVFRAADVAGNLSQLTRGTVAGRQAATGRTVFKSVGSALEDLTAAALVVRHHDGR